MIKTVNGGNNYSLTTGGRTNLQSNFFVNENTGFTVGNEGIILKTTNGGSNWIQQGDGKPPLCAIHNEEAVWQRNRARKSGRVAALGRTPSASQTFK